MWAHDEVLVTSHSMVVEVQQIPASWVQRGTNFPQNSLYTYNQR